MRGDDDIDREKGGNVWEKGRKINDEQMQLVLTPQYVKYLPAVYRILYIVIEFSLSHWSLTTLLMNFWIDII